MNKFGRQKAAYKNVKFERLLEKYVLLNNI